MPKFWVPVKNRLQNELIKRGHCVGCGRSLADADRIPILSDEQKEIVTCSCERSYIYDKQINHYRRASEEDIQKVR
ncbi:hypothetical protein KC573_01315 [candidate division WWE3 bacterium]|uniref:Uncharacterized protein n=1 Tax=candidate division WWE3 bacterium TaxID=2053526 RepID=A0A955LVI9_UNCKA|nr:hypothetical protein [candidate division WWE3 bacterium]